jgi:hypothetical protein
MALAGFRSSRPPGVVLEVLLLVGGRRLSGEGRAEFSSPEYGTRNETWVLLSERQLVVGMGIWLH